MFSLLLKNGSHCGSLESQSLRKGFGALFRLIDVNELVFLSVGNIKNFFLVYFIFPYKFYLRDFLFLQVLEESVQVSTCATETK